MAKSREEMRGWMRVDLDAVMAGVVTALQQNADFGEVQGELTGERQATRPQISVRFTVAGEARTFLYHVRTEGPIHTMVRLLVEDTIRTVPQRIFEPNSGRLQPNDVYYPTALGFTPTTTPGQASSRR